MSMETICYCRLCAEQKPEEQLMKTDDVTFTSKMETKLLWINVDISENNSLPKSICLPCYDLLEKTCTFLYEVKAAQKTLESVFGKIVKHSLEVKAESDDTSEGNAWKPVDQVKELSERISTTDPLPTDLNAEISDNINYNDSISEDLNTDSDQPLVKQVSVKCKEGKSRNQVCCDAAMDASNLLPNPEIDAVPLDASLYNMSWEDYTWCCGSCDAQCKTASSLRLHSLEIHSSCSVFKCSDCNRIITNYRTFISHIRMHYNHLRLICEYCNKNFKMLHDVKKHKLTKHKNEITFCCRKCGGNFESIGQLKKHKLTYAKGVGNATKKIKENKNKALKCEKCKKEFGTICDLKEHKLLHMERARDFSCHICEKMFFTKGALRTHMPVHEELKLYQCEFCQMGFKSRRNLISHLSVHTGLKPFICDQCGKGFRAEQLLNNHLVAHTDLLPYKCEYCQKEFRFKTHLNLHLQQHTGSRPYSCFYCRRSFTNGSNLKKYMKRKHNIDTLKKKRTESVPTAMEP